jgi:UDP-2-acetamido-2,6-beta-L-arabino-hexul-4-ose reductase
MKILVIGSNGFIAKNLIISLNSVKNVSIFKIKSKKDDKKIFKILPKIDTVFHLAGINRSPLKKDFYKNNFYLTKRICDFIIKNRLNLKFFYTSTTQTNKSTFYGLTKKKAEDSVLLLKKKTKCSVFIYKLPNIFGKGCLPFYNSVVATFCYQLARDKKVTIKNPKKILSFLYIDDLIESFKKNLYKKKNLNNKFVSLPQTYKISLSNIYKILCNFQSNSNFTKQYHQKGFLKKLFATYVSYLPISKTKNFIQGFKDSRGSFYEILKSKVSGQISFLSVGRAQTRGNHYHNTKVELFFLVSGRVKINTKNIFNNQKFSFILSSHQKIPYMVTQPGFAHNIVNIGKVDAKFIVWSNEIFNITKPDTHVYKISK